MCGHPEGRGVGGREDHPGVQQRERAETPVATVHRGQDRRPALMGAQRPEIQALRSQQGKPRVSQTGSPSGDGHPAGRVS